MSSALHVLDDLREHLLVDGYDLVLDLEKSQGSWLVDERDGSRYLDMFTFFASNALGMNHPVFSDPEVRRRLTVAAIHKPSNSDVYTSALAEFVATFSRVLGDPTLPYLFLVEGGALAVENALKAAFDWKSRRNEAEGRSPELGSRILHFEGAFHGRSGYTLSLTNTDPIKVARFPKFDWPRVPTPAMRFPVVEHDEATIASEDATLKAVRDAFAAHPHDIAGVIIEPIQGEGGDRHLSRRFLQELQHLTHEHDALSILDEVQTGVGFTGTPWAFQQLDLAPDLVAFGKKTHVCGVMGGGRMDEVEGHVWQTSSRINSTFGGSLVDMVRATVMLDVIERDGLIEKAATTGNHLLAGLESLAARHDVLDNPRGRGLFCAVDLATAEDRANVLGSLLQDEGVIMLGCGTRTLRLRPTMTVTIDEIDQALAALDRVLTKLA